VPSRHECQNRWCGCRQAVPQSERAACHTVGRRLQDRADQSNARSRKRTSGRTPHTDPILLGSSEYAFDWLKTLPRRSDQSGILDRRGCVTLAVSGTADHPSTRRYRQPYCEERRKSVSESPVVDCRDFPTEGRRTTSACSTSVAVKDMYKIGRSRPAAPRHRP
jgi:hypothetical protein